jgi:hypothetical protein
MVRTSDMVRFCRPFWIADSSAGMAIDARMPMIATTISSSINVKPWSDLPRGALMAPTEAKHVPNPPGIRGRTP